MRIGDSERGFDPLEGEVGAVVKLVVFILIDNFFILTDREAYLRIMVLQLP